MSMRRSRMIFGDDYVLSKPIDPVHGQPFRVLTDPITTATYSGFLNELGHVEDGNGPILLNTANYDQLLRFSDGTWHPKPGKERHPVTLVTFCGARLLAEWARMRLMEPCQWEAALASDRSYLEKLPSAALNIEDIADGPVNVDQGCRAPSNIRSLLGNVGFWGEQAARGFAWSFGVGWNKSRLHLRGPAARPRWIYAASVSTGIRLVELCEEGRGKS